MSNNKHLKPSRILLAMAIVSGSIIAADSVKRSFFNISDTVIIDEGDFLDSQTVSQNSANGTAINETSQQSTQGVSYTGYSEITVPASQLSEGLLAVSPSEAAEDTLVNLVDVKNEYYSLRSEDLMLNSDAASALNQMMADYNAATGLSDFVVYTTTQQYGGSDSVCSTEFAESASGYTVDLSVLGSSGNLLGYDGLDEEAWITENCASYGFILRYPYGKESITGQAECTWHFRYVGTVHANIMAQNDYTLEEYNNWIKSYTVETATLACEFDSITYEVYYAPYMGESTPVRVPVTGNYVISGNGSDGFIVTAQK